MSPDTASGLSKRDTLRELGIADRLLKYWMGWYKLPLNRRGRGTTYPHRTVESLKLIKRLSDTRYFTMRFIRDLLHSAEGDGEAAVQSALNLCRSRIARESVARPHAPSASQPPREAQARQPQKMDADLL